MKLRYLDGLRGVACLVVVLAHLAFIFVPTAMDPQGQTGGLGPFLHNTPLHLLIAGNLAVCVFFVLSGLVLSLRFFRTGETGPVAGGVLKRYVRLAAPVLGSTLLAYALMRLGWMHNTEAGAITSQWWMQFWQFEPSLWGAVREGLYGAFVDAHPVYNPVLWAMRVELWGSLMVMGILLLFGRLRGRWLVYVALGLILWQTYYLAFVLGVALCDLLCNAGERRLEQWRRPWAWGPMLALALFVGSYPSTTLAGSVFERAGWQFAGDHTAAVVHVVAAAGILAALLLARPVQRMLEVRPFLWVGRMSYSVYLVHFLVLGSFTSALFVLLVGPLGLMGAAVAAIVPSLAVIAGVAWLYARYVDAPAGQLANYLSKWTASPRTSRSESKMRSTLRS